MQLSNMDEKKINHIQSNIIKNRGDKDDRAVTIDLVDKLAILCKRKGTDDCTFLRSAVLSGCEFTQQSFNKRGSCRNGKVCTLQS